MFYLSHRCSSSLFQLFRSLCRLGRANTEGYEGYEGHAGHVDQEEGGPESSGHKADDGFDNAVAGGYTVMGDQSRIAVICKVI